MARLVLLVVFVLAAVVAPACERGGDEASRAQGPADHRVDLADVSPAGTRMPVRMAVGETVDVVAVDPAKGITFSVDGPAKSVGAVGPGVHRFRATARGLATVRTHSTSCDPKGNLDGQFCSSRDHGTIQLDVLAD